MRIRNSCASALIVAVGFSAGSAHAELALDETPVTGITCQAAFDKDLAPRRGDEAMKVAFAKSQPDNSDTVWPEELEQALALLGEQKFPRGTWHITDCVGNRATVRVRQREHKLTNIVRQRSERRGWRFNVEAREKDLKTIRRLASLDMPSSSKWQLTKSGDTLIAADHYSIPRVEKRPPGKGPQSEVNYLGSQVRIRLTELKLVDNGVQVTQQITEDGTFVNTSVWTFKAPPRGKAFHTDY